MFSEVSKKPIFEVFHRPKKLADVGIELEIEGDLPESVPHWQAKPEGSLQHGMEYITKPIKADVVKQYVDGLRAYIIAANGTIKNTYRCSTHIHVNVLNDTVEDVLGYIAVFTMFEPLLLSLCGPQRDGNLFCMSSYDTGDSVSSFESLCKTFERIGTHGWSYERGKYSSLNTGRLADLGTLEARCFPLSVDGDQVRTWVDWLLKIRDIVRAEPDKTFRSFWKNVRQNPTWYANSVFGWTGASVSNVSSLLDLGTENAYELTKILKKYHTKQPEKAEKKEKKGRITLSDQPFNPLDLTYAPIPEGSWTVSSSVGSGSTTVAATPWPAPQSTEEF